jgi:hypothetical protein
VPVSICLAPQRDILKAVRKYLGFLQTDVPHPSLNVHEFRSLKGPNGEKVFEAFAHQKTRGAYRVFWYYGPKGLRKNNLPVYG